MKKVLLVIPLLLVVFVLVGTGSDAPAVVEAQDYSDHTVVLSHAEIITDPLSGEEGRVVWLQNDLGNAQLGHDFVYADPRRALFNGGNAGITFAVDAGWTSADANLTNQNFWLHDSVYIWDRLSCSNLTLSENAIAPGTPGVVQRFFQTGVINADWQADITQVGFLSAAQFPYFAANPNVLGVTFTLTWVDGAGNPSDIDGNGKVDVAFREIYYNDQFEWADNGLEGTQPSGVRLFDLPTVAIHEVGHGFSQAHFGNIGRQDGVLIARPRTIMNAIYGGTLRDLTGRDNGGHCSNWAQWPNN